jgi:hypothetical protein
MIKFEMSGDQDFEGSIIRHFKAEGKKAIKDIKNIVKRDIEMNIQFGKSIYGGNVKPNKKRTPIFYQTGQLRSSVKDNAIENGYEIYIGGNRTQIGAWLHYGTSKMIARPFFGFSNEVLNHIDNYLNG